MWSSPNNWTHGNSPDIHWWNRQCERTLWMNYDDTYTYEWFLRVQRNGKTICGALYKTIEALIEHEPVIMNAYPGEDITFTREHFDGEGWIEVTK